MEKAYLRFIACCPECGYSKFEASEDGFRCLACRAFCYPEEMPLKEESEIQDDEKEGV